MLVVGNPANTNALIAASNAKGLDPRQFHAMTRLDHNRALSQLAEKTGAHANDIRRMTIWGNHSSTQFPDSPHRTIGGRPAPRASSTRPGTRETFIPTVQQRGAAIIKARGASSAASAASAAIDHVRDWILGTRRRRLGLDGGPLGRQLRHRARRRLLLSLRLQGRRLRDRARASRSTTSSARRWRPPRRSCARSGRRWSPSQGPCKAAIPRQFPNFPIVAQFRVVTPSPRALATAAARGLSIIPSGHQM